MAAEIKPETCSKDVALNYFDRAKITCQSVSQEKERRQHEKYTDKAAKAGVQRSVFWGGNAAAWAQSFLEEADLVASAILCLESYKTLRAPALWMPMAVEDKQGMSNGN